MNARKWLLISPVVLLVSGAGIFTVWHAAAATSAADPLARAPGDAVGIIHLEGNAIKSLHASLFRVIGDDESEEANALMASKSLLENISSADLFILKPYPKDGDFSGFPPLVLWLHAPVTVGDVCRMFEDKKIAKEPFQKTQEGAVTFFKGRGDTFEIVDGKQISQVGEGVLLYMPIFSPQNILKEIATRFGEGAAPELRKLAEGVNKAAPIWGAIQLPEEVRGELSEKQCLSIAGTLYPDGGKTSVIRVAYSTAEIAAKVQEEMAPHLKTTFSGQVEVERKDAELLVAIGSVTKALAAMVDEKRGGATQAARAANLRQIASAVIAYQMSFRGETPADLNELVEKKFLTPEVLVNSAKREKGPAASQAATAPVKCDYEYIRLPKMAAIRKPAEMVMAYERTSGKASCAVAFADGHVEVMSVDQLKAAIEKTQEAIRRK